ncbi:MAG TPA: hypothetical protein VHD35_07000 [Chitinophagaceae bacterium]|nr:hypothetical protein [Chitinophagaceae bacterium]
MQHYEIILKNEKEKTYRFISGLLISVNFITILLITIASDFKKIIPFTIAATALLSIPLLQYLKSQKEKLLFSIPFFLFALSWFCTSYWWIGVLNLIFFILDAAASKKLTIEFTENRIRFPSLFQRTILWGELTNALLKDGILTIDFKNNKIIQQQIDEANASINEKEFNDFCIRQLTSGNQKNIN